MANCIMVHFTDDEEKELIEVAARIAGFTKTSPWARKTLLDTASKLRDEHISFIAPELRLKWEKLMKTRK